MDMQYFAYERGRVMTGRAFEKLFGGPRRPPEGLLTQREFDLAASIQLVTEEVMLRLARTARERTGESKLCLAGGVALNCVANGRIVDSQIFDEVWVQPAAGDAGGALGAALAVAMERGAGRDHVRRGEDAMSGALLGPAFTDAQISDYLRSNAIPHHAFDPVQLVEEVSVALADGKVVGWFQGRMEFGPRALGARSILGDPRDPTMQSVMNMKIKFRESFRPFAPAVLAADAKDYFDLRQESPYMLLVAPVAAAQQIAVDTNSVGIGLLQVQRSTIPAVTHVDGSARVQTVTASSSPTLHALLTAFKARTGCPVLVNTSFNVRGEPIVHSPHEAYGCFMRTNIDMLALGNFVLHKDEQPQWSEETDWRGRIPLD
jgi:carbamoyltransferase